MKTPTRIYSVKLGETIHLVDASSPGVAVSHVYGNAGIVCVPKQADLVAYIQAGIKIEKARVEQAGLPL